jgi:hypothetical protein
MSRGPPLSTCGTTSAQKLTSPPQNTKQEGRSGRKLITNETIRKFLKRTIKSTMQYILVPHASSHWMLAGIATACALSWPSVNSRCNAC